MDKQEVLWAVAPPECCSARVLDADRRSKALIRFDSEGSNDDAEQHAFFMDDFEACITHLRMPITHRRAIRTTNLLERLFVEERRRLKIIPNAFGEKAVLKLMFGAMIRAAERWRAIRVSELERRQMRAVREELDQEYEAPNGIAAKTSAPEHRAKISSTART